MAAPLCVTVLAAGKGTRMRNALPKVLHPLAGRTLIEHVLASAAELAPARTVLVLADGMEQVAVVAAARRWRRRSSSRSRQLGTGHALMAGRSCLADEGTVLVLFGDTPLLSGRHAARGWPRRARRRMPRWRCWACGRRILPATAGCGSRDGACSAVVEDRDADDASSARPPAIPA